MRGDNLPDGDDTRGDNLPDGDDMRGDRRRVMTVI